MELTERAGSPSATCLSPRLPYLAGLAGSGAKEVALTCPMRAMDFSSWLSCWQSQAPDLQL